MQKQQSSAPSSSLRFWSGVQGATGLVFGGFLCVHAANTTVAAAGPGAFNAVQDVLRVVYQHPVVEMGVLGSLVLHVVASVVKKFIKSPPPPPSTSEASLLTRKTVHAVTGYVTLAVVFLHVYATRFAPAPPGARPQFNALSHTIHRLKGVFMTYYVVFGAAAVTHMLLGFPLACAYVRRFVAAVPRPSRVPTAVVTAAAAAVTLGVVAIGGGLYPVRVDVADPAVQHFDAEMAFAKGTSLWREY
jgi:succinate dehydrogenase/fumarate reductase cytochrome b subunit